MKARRAVDIVQRRDVALAVVAIATMAALLGLSEGARAQGMQPPPFDAFAPLLKGPVVKAPAKAPKSSTDPELRRKRDALDLIAADVDRTANAESRKMLLKEFLDRSGPFVKDYPDQTRVWVARGAAAVELEDGVAGWEAGRALRQAPSTDGNDPDVRRLMANLERKGWLGATPPLSSEASLEQRRGDALTGSWHCREAVTFEILDKTSPSKDRSRYTRYYAVRYGDRKLALQWVSGVTLQPDIVTDGATRTVVTGTTTTRQRAAWEGDTLVVTTSGDNDYRGSTRYRPADGGLTIDTADETADSRSTIRRNCERIDAEWARAEVEKVRARARSALDDYARWVRANALKISNLEVTPQMGYCEQRWTGPSIYVSDEPKSRDSGLFSDHEYEIERDQGEGSYRVDFDFWFATRTRASDYVALARKAAASCHDWQ